MYQIRRTQLLVAAALAASSAPVFAVGFSIEGKLTAFYGNIEGTTPATGADVKAVKCNGTLVVLKDGLDAKTVYTTPSSANVPKAAYFSTTALPGYSDSTEVALKDGTCIIEGNSVGSTFYADTFFAEPAENVLVGPVTSGPNEQFAIMGVPIVLLTSDTTHLQNPDNTTDPNKGVPDPEKRIVASIPVNQFGYPVVLSTVPKDDLSSAEGYLVGGKFYAFALETTDGSPRTAGPNEPPPALPAPTVQRGTLEYRSSTSSRMEIRGGCMIGNATTIGVAGTAPNRTQAIRVVVDSTPRTTSPVTTWHMPNNASAAEPNMVNPIPNDAGTNATCTEEATTPGSGVYRFRVDNYTYGGSTNRVAPVNVKVGIPGKSYSAPSVLERIKFP